MTESLQGHNELLALTADIVSSHFANNVVAPTDVPRIIASVYATLSQLRAPPEAPTARQEPAVPIRASIKPDFIVCLEDGRKMKMLKRHLMTRYGMTPDQYRSKWGLPFDYPVVAPNYAEKRRSLARSNGFGVKRVAKVVSEPRGRTRKTPVT